MFHVAVISGLWR